MSETEDKKLEKMLRSRRMEAASPDLAQRIVLTARQTPQDQPMTLARWVNRLFAEFHLPNPAYVLATTLLIGFVVGLNTPVENALDDSVAVSVQEFLYADEAIL